MNIHILGAFDNTIKNFGVITLNNMANHYLYHYKGKEDVQSQRLRDLAARGSRVVKLSKHSSPIGAWRLAVFRQSVKIGIKNSAHACGVFFLICLCLTLSIDRRHKKVSTYS